MAVLRRRALLIVNPASRRGARQQKAALDVFRRLGMECDVLTTAQPGHGARLAAERGRSYDAVFTLGGDGTVMEVIGALAHTGIAVGVLPGGTGNLIARTLGIPLDVGEAVRALATGDEARIDLGSISGHRFAFAAGTGIDASMIQDTPVNLKRRLGVLAYAITATKAALRRDSFLVTATVDGVTHSRVATAVLVANFGALFNKLFTLGPGIRQDDGMLDLCVFSPDTVKDAARIAWKLWKGDFRTDPCMLYTAGRRIRIDTDPPRPYQADGDLLGMTPFEAEVEPLAATLLVPPRG